MITSTRNAHPVIGTAEERERCERTTRLLAARGPGIAAFGHHDDYRVHGTQFGQEKQHDQF